MTDAKQTLIAAIAEQNFRSTASLADVHLASAIEALIDEKIKELFSHAVATLPVDIVSADASLNDSFRELREDIAKLE